jgi:hypothetical protein
LSANGKFTPSEAKAVDSLMDSFRLIRSLSDSEKQVVKEAIFVMLTQVYPDDFVKVENIQLNYKDNVGFENVV